MNLCELVQFVNSTGDSQGGGGGDMGSAGAGSRGVGTGPAQLDVSSRPVDLEAGSVDAGSPPPRSRDSSASRRLCQDEQAEGQGGGSAYVVKEPERREIYQVPSTEEHQLSGAFQPEGSAIVVS